MVKVFIAVLVGTIAMIVVFQLIDMNNQNSLFNQMTTLVSDEATTSISASISGQVTRPGTYLLDSNATLGDLIEVAYGVNTNVDELAYDTSYLVQDGYSFYIAPKYDENDVCSLEEIVKVNINEDDAEQLQSVAHIGTTIAKAIVSYREANGPFGRIEELKDVNGIGNATFEKVKNYVRLRNA